MSNDIMKSNGKVPSIAGMFEGLEVTDLQSNTSGGSFPRISIKGSKYRVKPPGRDIEPLMDDNGNVQTAVEFIVVDFQKGVSKAWYATGYSDGEASAPACFSHDGVAPAPEAQSPQNSVCASCPKNQFGSRITDAGKKAKACSDAKKLAVTFASNIDNEELGGVMQLKVPQRSHKDLDTFSREMIAKGFAPQQIVTRISFDPHASFPKLMYKAIRPLTQEELLKVQEWFHSEQVRDILDGQQHSSQVKPKTVAAPTEVVKVVDTEFEQPPAEPPKLKAVAPEPVKADKPADSSSNVDADLDAIMGDLDIG